MISVAAIRMQQFGVQFYQASLTANDIDKLVRFEVLGYGDQGQRGVRGGKKQAPHRRSAGICSSGASRRARRPTSATSSAGRSKSWSSTTSSAARRATCRRFPARSSSRADEKLSFEPVEAGSLAGPAEGARARRRPARHRRPAPAARPARRHRQLRTTSSSPCRRSSSTVCPKTTSCRCS